MKIEKLRNNHKKEIIIGTILLVVIGGALTFRLTHSKYRVTQSIDLGSGVINYKAPDFKIMAMYQQKDGSTCTNDNCYTEITDRMPSTGYVINESKSYCTLDNVNHDTEVILKTVNGNHVFNNLKKSDKCYLYFDKQPTASETILATGELIDDNGYRYEGKNVNNYIIFNGEVWRIIGVFDIVKHGGKTDTLIKIIRHESIGSIARDSSNSIKWNASSLKDLLNGDYYNKEGIYSSNGLNYTARGMVEDVIWYLGTTNNNLTTEAMYTAERDTTSSGYTTWTGRIGLIYLSDYGYASPSNTCDRTTTLGFYSNSGCYDNNWMYNNLSYWTIITKPSSSAYIINNSGNSSSMEPYSTNNVRPVLYLKSSIKIINGNGSESFPYVVD